MRGDVGSLSPPCRRLARMQRANLKDEASVVWRRTENQAVSKKIKSNKRVRRFNSRFEVNWNGIFDQIMYECVSYDETYYQNKNLIKTF